MNKKILAIAISSALTVPLAAHAAKFKVGGHVNRAVMFVDDGIASDTFQVDNSASMSRLKATGKEKLGIGGIDVGFALEMSFASNRNSQVTMKGANGNAGGADSFGIRQNYLWFGGKFGKVTMGHTSGAYDGVVNKSYAGIGLTGTGVGTTHGNSMQFRDSAGNNVVALSGARSSLDGGRTDLIKYDTPRLGPIGASVSIHDNQRWNAQVNANSSFSGAKIQAALGYEENTNNGNNDQWGGSAAILFSQGTNISVSYSEREIQAAGTGREIREADNFSVGLGHHWGNNKIGMTYSETQDLNQNGDEATSWGIGFIHSIPGPKVEIYAGYQNHDLDRTGTNVEDMDIFNIGTRVRF
jgi:hypothetical protein